MTTRKYGERGTRYYVPMEAGHVGANRYPKAESLGLSAVSIGGFRDANGREPLDTPTTH